MGADNPIPAPALPIRADVRVSTGEHEISVKGAQTESQLRNLYSKSTVFAATSRYDPTGLASVEAAFSRCALVANDMPVYRELWGDAALYFERNNGESLAKCWSNSIRTAKWYVFTELAPITGRASDSRRGGWWTTICTFTGGCAVRRSPRRRPCSAKSTFYFLPLAGHALKRLVAFTEPSPVAKS